MSRRLLLSYVGLAVLILLVLEVPLGIAYGRNERNDLTGKVERDAVAIASLSEDALQGRGSLAPLDALAARYRRDTGGRVVLVDRQGVSVVDSGAAVPRDFATRPEIAAALKGKVATGVRHSNTLGTNLLYVAEPVASGGVVHGAVRITYPTSAVDARVTRYWLMLAAIAALVLALAAVVGLVLARSVTRPLQALEQAAGEAGGGDLSVRAPEAGPPEVRSLAVSFNEMVRRLEELVGAQEVFVADASHQLRTPLTALRLRLENGDVDGALPEVERLSRLVDGLLALARAEAAPAEPVELAAAVADRLDAFAPVAAERRRPPRVARRGTGARRPRPARPGARQPVRERARRRARGVGGDGLRRPRGAARRGPRAGDERRGSRPRLRPLLVEGERLGTRAPDREAPDRARRRLGRAAGGPGRRARRRAAAAPGAVRVRPDRLPILRRTCLER